MLIVTHQMGFAPEFADRVCFFYAGRIAEQGPPSQLFGNPTNERTRQFLSAVVEAGLGNSRHCLGQATRRLCLAPPGVDQLDSRL